MLTADQILEIGKLISSIFMHIATLNTGMLVLIITIVEKVFVTARFFKSNFNKAILVISLGFFISSLLLSLLALINIPSKTINLMRAPGSSGEWVGNFYFYSSIILFCLGITFFIFLSAKNIFMDSTSAEDVTIKPEAQNNLTPKPETGTKQHAPKGEKK